MTPPPRKTPKWPFLTIFDLLREAFLKKPRGGSFLTPKDSGPGQEHHAADLAKVHLPKLYYIISSILVLTFAVVLSIPEEAPQD